MSETRTAWEEVGDRLYRNLELRVYGEHSVLLREDRVLVSLRGLGPYGKRYINAKAVWAIRGEESSLAVLSSTCEDSAKREAVQETLRALRREEAFAKKRLARLSARIDMLEEEEKK